MGRIAEAEEAAKASDLQEHWRLLYVAMTRAEEALFIGGSLGKREAEPKPDSWYARLEPLFGGDWLEDPHWGARMEHGERGAPVEKRFQTDLALPMVLPGWATTPRRRRTAPAASARAICQRRRAGQRSAIAGGAGGDCCAARGADPLAAGTSARCAARIARKRGQSMA